MSNSPFHFGTDGIRGCANKPPMTAESILRLGMAAAIYFNQKNSGLTTNRVIVAKDPRRSGYLFETALTAGLLSIGKEVFLVGPMPTPGLAFLSRNMRADFGVMISASHNLYYDNGIKVFDSSGYKLFKSEEQKITEILSQDLTNKLAASDKVGKATRLNGADGRYIQHIKNVFPQGLSLSNLKIVVDCANGATYKIAPNVLYELGGNKITVLANEPNGFNINEGCGSTYIHNTIAKVVETGADVGISFDGDGDRLIMVDEDGKVVDGDSILAIIANYRAKKGLLKDNKVVGTIISSLGLERFLKSINVDLVRTNVGDKYVIEYMQKNNLALGGEESGHILLKEYNTTSDALVACLEVLKIMLLEKVSLSSLNKLVTKIPKTQLNVKVNNNQMVNDETVQKFLTAIISKNKDKARIVVRASGTEPIIRVFVEGEDTHLNDNISKEIKFFLQEHTRKHI